MPFPPGYQLTDAEWRELLEVLSFQAQDDGVSTGDIGDVMNLVKQGWDLLGNPGLRRRFLDNRKPSDLDRQDADAQSETTRIANERAALGPNPGPVPPGPRNP